MHDQADQLRKLVRAAVHADSALAPGAPIIAISGGRTGAGVTTIASQLARELARLGKQVAVIDANLHHPAATPHGALTEVLAGTRRAIEVLTNPEDGVRVLPGCHPSAAPPLDREAVDRFLAELTALSRQVDVLLIDAGAGMNAWIDRLWQFARQVLLVATPESAALLDAYAAVKLSQFHRLDGKLRLVFNRCPAEADAAPFARSFAATCQRFLFISPKPAASPNTIPPAACGLAPANDELFLRAVRLLAADLACDCRATALRLPRQGHGTPLSSPRPAPASSSPADG